jgi:hypothetical protein
MEALDGRRRGLPRREAGGPDAESLEPVTFEDDRQCRVEAGRWWASHLGHHLENPRHIDVDHHVPLKNAHLWGGWRWDAEMREECANYLGGGPHSSGPLAPFDQLAPAITAIYPGVLASTRYNSSLNPESTEGGRRVSVLKWPKGAPLNLG